MQLLADLEFPRFALLAGQIDTIRSNIMSMSAMSLMNMLYFRNSQSSLIYSRKTEPLGKSWNKWIELWWNWALLEPRYRNPLSDRTGKFASSNQNIEGMWFLAGTLGGKMRRGGTLNHTLSIFFPLVNNLITYEEYPHLTSVQELKEYAKSDIDHTSLLELKVDNQKIGNLQEYRVRSCLFGIRLPKNSIVQTNACITQGISDGYWVSLKPLTIGRHYLKFIGEKLRYDQFVTNNKYRRKFKVEVEYDLVIK